MPEPLVVLRADVAKIVNALRAGRKIANIRLISGGKMRYGSYADIVTVAGEGWTLYATLITTERGGDPDSAMGFQLFGDQTRFEEDFITAKMTVC